MSDASLIPQAKERPQFRNIHITEIATYRLPPPGMVSILHRVSGALLFLALPFLLYLFDQSLISELSFDNFKDVVAHPFTKVVLLVLIWGYLHHFLAGLRHLVNDMHWALDLGPANKTAWAVLIVSGVLTVLVALKLFGVF